MCMCVYGCAHQLFRNSSNELLAILPGSTADRKSDRNANRIKDCVDSRNSCSIILFCKTMCSTMKLAGVVARALSNSFLWLRKMMTRARRAQNAPNQHFFPRQQVRFVCIEKSDRTSLKLYPVSHIYILMSESRFSFDITLFLQRLHLKERRKFKLCVNSTMVLCGTRGAFNSVKVILLRVE
jgi:hypothetical protein